MTARLVHQLGYVVLRVAVLRDQLMIALGFLDRIQVLTLNILDQRDLGRRRVVDLTDDRGDRMQARSLSCAPAALARNNFEPLPVWTKEDRLQNAALLDRIREFINGFFRELDPWLLGIRPDSTDLDLPNAARARRSNLA